MTPFMSISRLEFNINNFKRLPHTMLGMADKLRAYQQNLASKWNELHQLKDKVSDEKGLNKRIAYVEGMLDFWYKRNHAGSFSAEDAAFTKTKKLSLRDDINSFSIAENRDFGNFVAKKDFIDLCGRSSRGRINLAKFLAKNETLLKLKEAKDKLGKLYDFFSKLAEINEKHDICSDYYEAQRCVERVFGVNYRVVGPEKSYAGYLVEKKFIDIFEDVKRTLCDIGINIDNNSGKLLRLTRDQTNENSKRAYNNVLSLMRSLFLYRRLYSSYHYHVSNMCRATLRSALSKITKEYPNAIDIIQKNFDRLLEMKKADTDWSIERFSKGNVSFDEKIEEMNKKLEEV
jgi:hypothetical protein